MNKLYILLGVLGLAMVGAITFAKADEKTEMFNPAVQLANFCSGSIIHSDRDKISGEVETFVLTAKHCVEGVGERIPINQFEYDKNLRKVKTNSYEAKVWGLSYKSDLALLRLEDKNKIFEDVATVAPKDIPLTFGQPVFIVAFPLGLSMTYTQGTLGFVETGMFSDVSESTEFLRSTPDVAPGSSGSAMYTKNDKGEFQIIGTTTGMLRGVTFMNYFTPVNEINEYLDVAKKSWKSGEQKEEVE